MSDDGGLEASQFFLESSRFWIQRVFVPILVLIGVCGNVITIIVFTRRRMRCTTHIYLTALAIADLIHLLFVLILSFEQYPNLNDIKYTLYWRFYGIIHWLCDAASSSSIWFIVSFTVERYIIVCHPLKGKVYCNERRAKNIITIVALLCFVATASTAFEYQLKQVCTTSTDKNTTLEEVAITLSNASDKVSVTSNEFEINNDTKHGNDTKPRSKNCTVEKESTELANNETYTAVFYWFSAITFALLPLVLIAAFNCFLVRAVYRSTKTRKLITNSKESSKLHNENRMTILLIGIVVMVLICQTPTALFLIYDSLDDNSSLFAENIKKGLGNIFNLLLTINASCNFIMYCVLSKNYRQTLKTVCCTSKTPNGSGNTAFAMYQKSRTNPFRRNQSEYCTPRNIETLSLTSIPRTKSLMVRPLGKARSSDLNV